MPEPDEKMATCIKTQRLSPKEISKIYKTFQKYDKARTGVINLNDFLKKIEEKRTFFTDAILECFDIALDENGCIDFSDYLVFVVSYCMFEKPEIQKLCFYIFDDDKGGTIDADELKMLMNTLYDIKPPNTVRGNAKGSWLKLEFNTDMKVDFEEFVRMNEAFPWIFNPAYRLQNNMMLHVMGEWWWSVRKRRLQNEKNALNAALEKKRKKKEQKKKNAAQRHIRKRMGLIRFLCCPCLRHLYDNRKNELTAEEIADRDRKIAAARRAADLAAKNPVTHPWKRFEAKIDPEQGKNEDLTPASFIHASRCLLPPLDISFTLVLPPHSDSPPVPLRHFLGRRRGQVYRRETARGRAQS